MTLLASHLLNLFDFAACKGVSVSSLQRLLDTPDADLHDPQGRVSVADYMRVWEALLSQGNDPHLGLHFGYFLNLKGLGLIYQISLATSSIEQAMGLLSDYLKSSFPVVSVLTEIRDANVYISLHSPLPDTPATRQLLDSVLVLMAREIGIMIDGNVAEIQLPYEQLDAYRRLAASPVVASDGYRIRLEARQLAGSINRRRLKNIEALLPVFLQLTSPTPAADAPFADQVRQMTLSLCAPELPQLDQVVAQFAMSHRTFQRRLTDEGTSFRAIADALKRQLAGHLERGKALATQDIAYILGYSASSAYLHAARKWRNQPHHPATKSPYQEAGAGL
ncbi:AraC family transcriptional regulator ligand-binding domain-containing protein [Fibrella sp. WM1]|uniref:AraC family transcriptional regulator ligand-binding domain-containing protein n=1 Tax=Fibrella musci TaxID=3242485 RepID=UPI003522B5E8